MKTLPLLLCLAMTTPVFAQAPADPIKKSSSGICHAPGGKYYNQTKKFKAFKTMEACLKSGGRMPKR